MSLPLIGALVCAGLFLLAAAVFLAWCAVGDWRACRRHALISAGVASVALLGFFGVVGALARG